MGTAEMKDPLSINAVFCPKKGRVVAFLSDNLPRLFLSKYNFKIIFESSFKIRFLK